MKRLLDRALSYLRGRPEAGTRRRPAPRPRLGLEPLEDRSVPSATLVRDINPGAGHSNPNPLYNREFAVVGSRVYFAATDPAGGRELWVTDGTDAGTRRVRDINPGAADSYPAQLTAVGDRLYFVAHDRANDRELWATDGTEAGTRRVKDVWPGTSVGAPGISELTAAGSRLYFTAQGAAGGRELWTSDGTEVGTRVVRDIYPGGNGSFPTRLTAVGSRLYFQATDPAGGNELWVTDGTEAGTRRVKDVNPGAAGSGPTQLTAVGSRLYFVAYDPAGGHELWVTDGTEAGTRRARDINPGVATSNPEQLTAVGSLLYFAATDPAGGRELWATDGTEAGTRRVKDVSPAGSSNPAQLTAVGDRLYFTAASPTGDAELWTTDGTEAGTRRVRHGASGFGVAYAVGLKAVGSRLFFVAGTGYMGVDNREVWVTDGTDAGTRRVKDVWPGTPSSSPGELTPVGSLVYFAATDPAGGRELWVTDGTEAGTRRVRDANPGTNGSDPDQLVAVGDRLYFTANDGVSGRELWTLAGAAGGRPTLGFAHRAGSAGYDAAGGVGTDAAGNVYVTGTFQGTVDFDPGPGVVDLTAATTFDTFVTKYTPAGALVWARRVPAGAAVTKTAFDAAGNVYLTGSFEGTVDFGPGAGTLTSGGGTDAFVAKLDAAGNYAWARRLGGTGEYDRAAAVAADAAGNVAVVGTFGGAADFDPGPGTFAVTAPSGHLNTGFVVKLDAGGNFVWARTLSSDYDRLDFSAVAVDAAGNVVSAGTYQAATIDFDPGPGTLNLTNAGSPSVFVWKLDAAGNLAWARRLAGSLDGGIAALTTDAAGNVYSVGSMSNRPDFDPGPGVFQLPARGIDGFVWKLDAGGNFVWARSVGGESFNDSISGVAVDGAGNVYAAGTFSGTADFDPGSGTLTFASGSRHENDGFVWKLDRNGNLVWACQLVGDESAAAGVAVDAAGNVYAAGSFSGAADFDPGSGTAALTSGGGTDGFVWKLAPG